MNTKEMEDTPFERGPPPHKGGSDLSSSKGEDDFEDDRIIDTAEYREKFSLVLKYKPFLEIMIQRLEKATDKARESQLIKMQSLYDILFNPTKQLRLGTIVRCDKVLKTLYEKIEKTSILLPEESNKIEKKSCTITKPFEEQTTSGLIENHQNEVIKNDTMTDLEKESDVMRYSNLNNDFQSINVNDVTNSQKSGEFSTSKVNEESRRKLCKIIKKQRQEEFESTAINNKNEQITSEVSASSPVDLNVSTPSNNVRPSEIDNNQLNVTHTDMEPVLQPNFDALKIVENCTPVNSVSPNDGVPFSSTAVDDYTFESLDIDDRERYFSWQQQNTVKSDQSEKMEANLSMNKTKILPIPQECSPLSTNLHRHDIVEINQNIHTSQIQDNSYKSPIEYNGLNNSETPSDNPYKPPFEKESTDFISPKNNTNSESSKPLVSENRLQSLREKLTEEISAVHKVGTSCGGALRSLIHRDDKIIAPNRMANLKAGTIMDLMGKDKPPTRISLAKPKSNFGKSHDERSKLHNIPLSHSLPTPLALNDNNNTNVFPQLGFENNSTLTALTKMNPKELERIVNDHILKLPNSSETINSNLIKEGDFPSNHPNSETDRNIVHPNVSNVRTNNTLSSSTASLSDPRNGIHNLGTPLNIPRYEASMQNYPITSGFPSNPSPFSQPFNPQSPATNISQKFVYSEGTQSNRPLCFKTNIEPEDHMLTTGVYKNPGMKIPDNICNRNQQSSSFVNYNNPSSEHWKLEQNQENAYSRNQTTNHYHHSVHQPDRFKWVNRPSTSTDPTSGYNVHNRNSINQPNNSNKNLNTTKESRISDLEHRNRSVSSQRPISARDPRRRSVEEPNRSKSNDRNICKTEQPRNSRNTDPRLSRNSKRGSRHDYISNRDPRMRGSSSSTMYRRNRSHEKNNTSSENDFKLKGTFSSPLDKLYTATSELKTGKGYGPQKFKIPKLKTSQNNDIFDKNKNDLPGKNKSKEIKIMDEHRHNKNKQSKYSPKKTVPSVPDGQNSANLKKDSLSVNNRRDEQIKEDNTSDDEVKPHKNSKQKRNLWDESIESTGSNDISLYEKEVGTKRERKKEDNIPKDKKERAKVKTSIKKLVDDQKSKKNIEDSVEVEISRSGETELENKTGDLGTNDNFLKVSTISDNIEIISQSKNLSTNISVNPTSNNKFSPESKIKDEDMRNMFPSSLWDLLASEEKMKFFSKLGENLNADKLKRIKQIIESNSDDEEEAKKISPSPAQIDVFSNSAEIVDTKISPSFNQTFEDCEKQYENPVCNDTQITRNEELTRAKNLDEKMNEEKSLESNPNATINCKSIIREGHKSVEAIDENVKDEERGVVESDLDCENSKPAKKGRAKKNNSKQNRKIPPASESVDAQNVIEMKKPKKKQKNELEKLQEDIRDMFISKGVVAATGMRLCRLRKAIDAVGLGNDPKKEPVLRESKSCSKNLKKKKTTLSSDDSDISEDEILCKKRITSHRSSSKNSISSKKFIKEDNDVPSTSSILKQNFNNIDTNSKEKSIKIGTDLLSSEAIGSAIVIIEKTDLTKFGKKSHLFETDVPHGKKPSKIVTKNNNIKSKLSEILTKEANKSFIENNISSVKEDSADPKAQKNWAIKVQRKYKIKKPTKSKTELVNKSNVEDQKLEVNVEVQNLDGVSGDIHYYQENENFIYKCKICDYQGKMIVRHYVGTHPEIEVEISRISPDSAKQAIEESNIMKFDEIHQNNTVSSKRKKKIFNCRMCTRSFANSVIFFDHVSFHTGEYRYECHICKTRVSSKSGLKSHLSSSHYGGKKVGLQIKGTVYTDPPNSDILLGYLCLECNFVQLISTNMDKHLTTNHNENGLRKLSKAIKINLSKPTSDQEISDLGLIYETKDNIVLLPEMESKIESIDELNESLSEIKIEQPSDITIIDVMEMREEFQLDSNIANIIESNIDDASVEHIEDQEGLFIDDASVGHIEDQEGPFIDNVSEGHREDQEGPSNPSKEVDLNVFLGYENITIEDDELNMERERIMNDIVIKLKTQTKPQKDSVLDQIQTKLNKTDIDDDAMKNKDTINETSSPRSRSYLTKEKLGDLVNNYSPEESDLPVRRTLPERSCKEKGQIGLYTHGKHSTNIEDDSDSSMGEFELELKKYVEELRMSTSDHSDIDDDLNNDFINAIEIASSKVPAIKNKPMSNTIIRLQDTLNRPESVYNTSENESLVIDDDDDVQCEGNEIILLPALLLQTTCDEMDNYIANFGNHVVHIDKLPLNVGPLEVYNSNGCVTYRCHFNCDFTSTSIVAFGEHIKAHPRYSCAWNGRCLECNIIYCKEVGKPTLYALTTAFSHLMAYHLFQQKTHVAVMNVMKVPQHEIPPPPPSIPLSEYYKSVGQSSEPPKPKGPLLRVRRLSGDMLSAPAVENSLAPNNNFENQEVLSNALEIADITDLICYENNVLETNLPETPEDEMCNFLRIESVVSLNPENGCNFSQPLIEGEFNATISLSEDPRSCISLPQQSPVQQSVPIITLDSSPEIEYINSIPMDVGAIVNYATTSNNMDVISTPEMTSTVGLNIHQLNQRSSMTKRNLNFKTVGSNAKTTETWVKFSDLKRAVIDYKSISAYDEMLVPKKLRHFYKCMGQVCTFSCASMEKFAVHYEQHRSQPIQEGLIFVDCSDPERAWRVCPYCYKSFDCARDYCIHMKKEHGYSNMQCAFCFYRSATLGNVLYHQNTCHITMKMQVLECESQGLEPLPHRDIQFDNHIKPYVCGQGKCSMISFIPENFRRHLQTVHSHLNMFRCHICVGFTASLDRLIEHYTTHGIGMYQCLFCVHGTSFENEMREHLCYTHSNNQPSAVTRVDITTKNSDKTSNKQPLERLKRINFKELEEKIHTVIPFPPGENDEVVCNTSNRNVSEVDSITSPEINIDDDILIIDTVKKADKIIEVICLDSSDEDECLETSTFKRNRSLMDNVLPCNKKSKISSPIFYPSTPNNKRKGSPIPNISDDSQSILESSSNCDKSPAIKKFKGNSTEESNINQSSLFQNDDGQQIIKTIPNVTVVKEASPDTPIKPTITSNINPKSGLTGIELFRCGNKGCDHGVQDALLLKEHHATCDYTHNSQLMKCVHCNKLFKTLNSYIDHIRIHGSLRYRCSLCEFKAPVSLRVVSHMKQVHRISNSKVEPMNPREQDHDVHQFVCIPKVNSKGGKANAKKNNGTKSTIPSKFSLTDIDKIPLPSIFASPLGCSSCTYETKVRSNLVQHLTLHAAGHSVPQEEIVNPVPCLDKHEKMFDKMMNLASSSHTNSDKGLFQEVMKEEKNQYDYPVYIPSNQRYVCHAEGCTYVTIDDTMLRYHIRTLHNEETTYRCPHCPSTDPLSLMPIDRLSTHLKMHDVKLYCCSACSYYHFSRYVVERHVNDKHPNIIASSKTIRENGVPQSNKGLHTEEVSKCDDVGTTENLPLQPEGSVNQNNLDKKMWRCNLCKYRSGEEKSMRFHSRFSHRMTNQYKCRLCVYESDVFTNFEDHFSKFHPNLPTQIITSFNKVVEMPSTSFVDSGSSKPQEIKTYWRRNSNTVKHIRGILLDEETSAAKTSSAVTIAKAATAVSMIKTPATTKTITATTVSIPKEDPEPEFVSPLTDKYGPYGEPTSENLYQCPLCKQTYKYRRDLKDHISRDLGYTPWLCTHCCKTYINKTLVTKHIKVVHAPDTEIDLIRMYQPDEDIEAWMNNVFSVQQSLMKNLVVRVACRKKVQKKGIISVNTTTQKKLVQDDDRKGQPSTNTEKITKEDGNQELVMKKKKSHTKGKLKFMCGYCSTATVYSNSLRSHQLKKHPDRPLLIFNYDGTPDVIKRKSYDVKSNNCNLSIGSDDCPPLMEEDEEEMEGEETRQMPYYSCYYCKWSSQSISNLKDHWKSLHKEPIYNLNNVEKPGTGVCFLFTKSKCSSESVYSCEWCDKQGSLEFLKQHSSVHVASKLKLNQTHSKKYKCSKCYIMLSSVDMLKRHFALEHKQMELSYIVVETPEETSIIDDEEDFKDCIKCFKCPRCPFSSQTHQNVIQHLERHFMNFCCGVCAHQYLSYNSLRNHMILKHPDSSVEPNIVHYSDSEIEKLKKAIIVVEESCDKGILGAEFKVPEMVTKAYGQKCSASVTCTESTTKRKKKDVSNNLLKLNPKSKPNTKLSLKLKDTKMKMYNINSTDILKNPKTHNRPELQLLNEVNTITVKSHGKIVNMSLLDFTTLFEIIYPKIMIEQSLIVQA